MAGKERIHGWREIAAYLGCDEQAAKRWETQRGLPVRRIPGEGGVGVSVQPSEVEAWLLTGVQPGTGPESQTEPEDQTGLMNQTGPRLEMGPDDETAAIAGATDGVSGAVAAEESATAPGIAESGGIDGARDEAGYGESAGPASTLFRPSEHVSLLVSLFGLALLLTATAVRFFHVGPLEAILFASEMVAEADGRGSDAVRDEFYLRGVYLCEMRSPASLEEAQRLFTEAIARDSRHAPSYSGLAKTYLLLREYATLPEDEAYGRAKEAAERAVRLDPTLTEAHAALGFVDFFWLRRADDAEREFGLALETDDRSALTHHWFGSMRMHQGRYAEAVVQLDIAQRLNPTSTAILASKALALGFGGHKDEGMRLLEAMDGTGQDAAMVHRNLGYLSLVAPRDTGRFLRESVRFAEMRRDAGSVALLRAAGEAFGAGGETAMWEAVLREEGAAHPEGPTYRMAQADAALGHEQVALRELAQLAKRRDERIMGIMTEPMFLPLHKDAGFMRIAEDLGLVYPVVAAR